MKKQFISILFLLITTVAIGQEILIGKVVKVADGDTITILTSDFSQVPIRLQGIDCPEKAQDFGKVAKQFTSDLVFGKIVKVEVVDSDRYGRAIGIVTLPDGKVLNNELLKAGLAWHYIQYDHSKKMNDLEAQAKSKRLGLWLQPNAVAPWLFRRK